MLGNDRFAKEDYAEATKLYKLALFKTSNLSKDKQGMIEKLWKNLAISYYYSNNLDDALKAIGKSIRLSKNSEKVEIKAAILEDQKRYDSAISYLKSKLRDPAFTKAKRKEWIKEIKRLKKLKLDIKE